MFHSIFQGGIRIKTLKATVNWAELLFEYMCASNVPSKIHNHLNYFVHLIFDTCDVDFL